MFKFSSKIILRSDVPRKDGSCLLCIQCFINKKRIVEPLSIYLKPQNFDKDKGLAVYIKEAGGLTREQIKNVNDLIDSYCNRVYKIRTNYQLNFGFLTAAKFREEFRQEYMASSFTIFMEQQIKIIEGEKTLDVKTIAQHKKVLNKLKRFQPEISFGDLTLELIKKFQGWLINTDGLAVNTQWSIHKVVKKYINIAILKYKIQNPYDHFKAFSADTERVFLEKHELDALIKIFFKKELPDHLQKVLRYYLFACMVCGARISDITKFGHDNIVNNKLTWIMFKNRVKKRKRISINLFANGRKLIQTTSGKLFQTVSEQKTNTYLKDIAGIAEINKDLTFKSARHTFATQFLIAGGQVEVLQKLLGHSKIETTMVYVHIVNSSKEKQLKKLNKKFNLPDVSVEEED